MVKNLVTLFLWGPRKKFYSIYCEKFTTYFLEPLEFESVDVFVISLLISKILYFFILILHCWLMIKFYQFLPNITTFLRYSGLLELCSYISHRFKIINNIFTPKKLFCIFSVEESRISMGFHYFVYLLPY